jgi:hypothetical protein
MSFVLILALAGALVACVFALGPRTNLPLALLIATGIIRPAALAYV